MNLNNAAFRHSEHWCICAIQLSDDPEELNYYAIPKIHAMEHLIKPLHVAVQYAGDTYVRPIILIGDDCCFDDSGHERLRSIEGIMDPISFHFDSSEVERCLPHYQAALKELQHEFK